MKKTIAALFAGAAVAVAVGFASGAGAQGEPVGGCPPGDGWELRLLADTLPGFDVGNFHDQNGDGWICRRVNRGRSSVFGSETWTVKDNTNPLPPVTPPPPPAPPGGFATAD